MAKARYELQPNADESVHGFNSLCREADGKHGQVECIPRHSTDEQSESAGSDALTFEEAPLQKPYWETHLDQLFLCGCALVILAFTWWLFTRRPALRNNILIGGATIGAFCLNPIAGAIVLAAWIFSSRIGQMKS